MSRFLTWAMMVMLMPFTENIWEQVSKGGNKGRNVFTLGYSSIKKPVRDAKKKTSALEYSSLEFRRLIWCRNSHLGAFKRINGN